jgi:hypothetical protein
VGLVDGFDIDPVAEPLAEPMPDAEPDDEPDEDVPGVPEVPDVLQAVNANAQAIGMIHFFIKAPW